MCRGCHLKKKRYELRNKKDGEGCSKDGEGCSKDGEGSSKSPAKVPKRGRVKRKDVKSVEKEKMFVVLDFLHLRCKLRILFKSNP